MFHKRLNAQSARDAVPQAEMCVCARLRGALQNKLTPKQAHFEFRAGP